MSALGAPPEMRTAVNVSRTRDATASADIAGSSSSTRRVSTARATEGACCCAGELTPVLAAMCEGVSSGPVDSQATHSGQRDSLFVRRWRGLFAADLPIGEVTHELEVAGQAALVAQRPEAAAREALVAR